MKVNKTEYKLHGMSVTNCVYCSPGIEFKWYCVYLNLYSKLYSC